MVPKESVQVQNYRFHKDATLNCESFHNSNLKKKIKNKNKTKNTKTVQTWSLNYKKKASKDCIVLIHTLYYPRIKIFKKQTTKKTLNLQYYSIFQMENFLSRIMLPQGHKTIHKESEKFSTRSREHPWREK